MFPEEHAPGARLDLRSNPHTQLNVYGQKKGNYIRLLDFAEPRMYIDCLYKYSTNT